MNRKTVIDENMFYQKGYCKTLLLKDVYDNISKILSESKWKKDPDGIYKYVPEWSLHGIPRDSQLTESEFENSIAQRSIDACPDEILIEIYKIIESKAVVSPWLKIYNLKLDFIDIWDGLENNLDWHWDGPGQSEVISIFYPNEIFWNKDRKGGISVGERDLAIGSHWLKDYSDVVEHETMLPAGRNQIWINNQNPRFVHKPVPLTNKDDKRITITFGCSLILK